jgi:hypothetical protein
MIRSTLILITALILASPGFAVDYGAWVRTTDRSFDPQIILLLDEENFTQGLDIATALGERTDQYFSDILAHFLALHRRGRQYETERLLVALLASAFRRDRDPAEQSAWLEANREALLIMIDGCEDFENPELRSYCLRLAVLSREEKYFALPLREAARLVVKLKKTRGLLDRAETEEILVICEAIEAWRRSEYRSLLDDLARYSNDPLVVKRVRELAARLDRSP